MLGEPGSAVVKAVWGEAALGMVDRGERFDLLVTDQLMPGITGTDSARAVRGLQPDGPVLLVSGYAENDGVAAGLPQLTKPLREDELASSLARLDHALSSARVAGIAARSYQDVHLTVCAEDAATHLPDRDSAIELKSSELRPR